MKTNFNERLCGLLKSSGMSQKDLAQKAGVTESAVSHYVKGDRTPRANALSRIADALGTTSDYLLNGSASDDEEVVTAKRLIARNVNQMSREEKMEIVSILLGED